MPNQGDKDVVWEQRKQQLKSLNYYAISVIFWISGTLSILYLFLFSRSLPDLFKALIDHKEVHLLDLALQRLTNIPEICLARAIEFYLRYF